MGGRMRRVFREILPAFIFFFVMFHILAVSRSLVLRQYGIIVPASAAATIGALIVAKAVLIAGRLPVLNLYPRRPLIDTVILKTLAFSLITLLFLAAEQFIHLSVRYGNASEAWVRMRCEVSWPAFWLRQMWFSVLLFFYCAAGELVRALGADRVREIFFSRAK